MRLIVVRGRPPDWSGMENRLAGLLPAGRGIIELGLVTTTTPFLFAMMGAAGLGWRRGS